ncbi:M16 family metallopeptidase [Pontixanthobacter aquaemixtae]|uniref:Insulinase family protein n=1 Tax=Pontixanthobacter aquaemixtae TaxID=1958940 RepID=A0A844ZP59_9SPHN|nr:pitrilysin family protein [Pontixanthobacter aquaemixtae]MXO89344.1 insulinase family protein [Pontixanthobacter aquaemixtae]
MFRSILAAGTGLLALAAAQPAFADDHAAGETPAITAPEIEFTEWTLDNGLRVIAVQDDTTATVTTSMWYDIGSKLDPEGRTGFAHLFEHILSRKTENMPYNMIYGLTADIGGTRNASNSPDRTNYYEQVPAEYLEAMLWTHKERMALPVVDQDVFDKEREVVKEELRQRVLAPPYGRFQRFVLPENSFDVLPQRRPGIGSIEDLDSATLDDARAFFQAYYGPDTATLIVAGNFEMDQLRSLVDEYFAAIPRRENPVALDIPMREPERTEPRFVTATAPNVPLPLVGATWKVPGAAHPDIAALEVLDYIMSSGENSRLHQALIRTGKAVDVAEFVNPSEEGGFFAQFAIINRTADPDEVIAILEAERAKLLSEPVSAAELAEAKTEIFSSALRRRETARGRAFEIGEALVRTGQPEAADTRLQRISAVTAADIQRVARQYLKPEARVELRYIEGDDDRTAYTNPAPFPTFRTLPAATGEPRKVKPEGERQAPPGPGAKPAIEAPTIVETTLDNGIEVVATQTGNVPIATMTVLFPGGSASDPRAKAGIAEMAAALADKGTANLTSTEIAARLESLGARFSGTAATDGTYFSLTAPVATFRDAGEVMADIINSASYPEEEFARERKRAVDGLQISLKDPGDLARFVSLPVMYGDAPYGTIGGGTTQSLAAISPADLIAHREKYWHPARAKVIVSGGIAPDAATQLVGSLLGDWTVEAAPPEPVADPDGEALAPRTVVIDMPDAGQAAVIAGVRALSRSDEDYYSLMLANAVLGGGSSGRLFDEVRTKRALSYGAYSGFGSRAGESVLTASAQTKNETAAEVAQIFLDEFERLGTEPLPEDLLEKRRLYLGGSYSRSLETSSGFNGITAGLMLQGIEPAEASRLAEKLSAVRAEDASRVAADVVDPTQATIIIVGDSKQFIDKLRAMRPQVEVISADQLDLSSSVLKAAE